MRKLLPIFLIIALVLPLAGCGSTEPTAPTSTAPSVEPSEAPTASSAPTAEPSTAPSSDVQHQESRPQTAQILDRWSESTEYPLNPYLMEVTGGLYYATSDVSSVDADPPIGGCDWLLRFVGGDEVCEVAAMRPWYDEDGVETLPSAWQSGPNGAGVDIETGEAMAAFVALHPEFLPVSGARIVGEATVLTTRDGASVVFAQAHTASADAIGEDYADLLVFLEVPIDAASPAYSGAYSTLMFNTGDGWSQVEG